MMKTKFDPDKIWLSQGHNAVNGLRQGSNFVVYKRELDEVMRKGCFSLEDFKITEEEVEELRREHLKDKASRHWYKLQTETWVEKLSEHLHGLEEAMRTGSLGPRDIGISEEELYAKRMYVKALETGYWKHH